MTNEPIKGSNVSVATALTGRERILAVRLGVSTSLAKTIAIPVSLLDAYTSLSI